MSTEVVVMQKPLKAEVQSPVKPEVLKPSNTANLQNITNISAKIAANNKAPNFTNKITSNAITKSSDSFTGKHVLGRVNIRIQPITSKPSVIRSPYHQSTKSPFKPLTPIRPSPTPKSSLTSPICATTPTSPIRTPTSATKGLDSSSLSASFNTLLASPSSSSTTSLSPTKCRRRISYSDTEVRVPVSRRNARERNRVKQVSQGFAILRQHVPQAARKKKLSKVETLRCAVDYIRGLQLLLDDHPSTTQQPLSTTTPSHLHHHHLHHHHHHHQQQQQQQLQHQHPHQVFLQPHPAIEPHILKLPVSDETFQSPASLRYDGVAGAFLRTSPTDSEGGQSPAHVFYSDKLSSSSTTSPSSSSSSSSSSSMGVSVGAIKTEGNEARNYGREEQDLLDALAWWQHNIQP